MNGSGQSCLFLWPFRPVRVPRLGHQFRLPPLTASVSFPGSLSCWLTLAHCRAEENFWKRWLRRGSRQHTALSLLWGALTPLICQRQCWVPRAQGGGKLKPVPQKPLSGPLTLPPWSYRKRRTPLASPTGAYVHSCNLCALPMEKVEAAVLTKKVPLCLTRWEVLMAHCVCKDCSPPDPSVHGISQVRILEWLPISFSRRSSWPRDWTWVSCFAGRFFTVWDTRERE